MAMFGASDFGRRSGPARLLTGETQVRVGLEAGGGINHVLRLGVFRELLRRSAMSLGCGNLGFFSFYGWN
jgi:hypothetical protein